MSGVSPFISLKRMVRSEKKRMIQAIAAAKEVSRMMALLPKSLKNKPISVGLAYNNRKMKGLVKQGAL
jgi:hypothetical protein